MGLKLQARMRDRVVLLNGIVSHGMRVDGIIDDLALRVYVGGQSEDWLFQCGALATELYMLAYPDDLQWVLDTVTVPAWLDMATSVYSRLGLHTGNPAHAVMGFTGLSDRTTELEFFSWANAILTRYRMMGEADVMVMSDIDTLSMRDFELIEIDG